MGLNIPENPGGQVTDLMSRFGVIGYVIAGVLSFVLVRKFIKFMKGGKRKRGGKFLGLF